MILQDVSLEEDHGWGALSELSAGEFYSTPGARIHAFPLNDLADHVSHECPCNPETVEIERDDGTVRYQINHNSFDHREDVEWLKL